MYGHNPELTLVRLTAGEMGEIGRIFAAKANKAVGPTVVCVPMRGFSVPDTVGGQFWDPEADMRFVDALRRDLASRVRLELIDAHVNDDEFVDAAVNELQALIAVDAPPDQGARSRPPTDKYDTEELKQDVHR